MLASILTGLEVATDPVNLLYVLAGVSIGMVIGVLPGLGPAAGIALLLPLTYTVPPESAIILLAGIYYGSYYGGTITSVLLNLPGEAASVVTTFDGYPMAREGRAGQALGIAAIGSFIGGTVSLIGMTLLAPALASFAVKFGPPEFTALTVLGVLLIAYLGRGSMLKSLIAAAFGLLLATVGQDPVVGAARYTFGSPNLLSGLDFVAVAMGLFGVGEVLYNLEQRAAHAKVASISRVWPTMQDWVQARGSILRGSVTGFFIGILPGGGGVVSSLASYAMEKRRARDPSRFGKGAIEGVAGPETANNASSTSAFIPLLTLGLPANAVLALIFGALLVQGVTPGPQLIDENPEIFWGVIVSMYIGNLVLLVLNIPAVRFFVQVLRVRGEILGPVTILIVMLGMYSVNNNVFDLWIVLVFGVLGYVMRKTGFDPGPLVLAFVLGPIMEESLRQSLLLSDGDPSIFFTRPISGSLLALIVAATAFSIFRSLRRRNDNSTTQEAT